MTKTAVIYYFCGTYNSKWAAQKAGEKLQNLGYSVDFTNIENNFDQDKHHSADIIGIVYPVYAFGLAENVINFLDRLPKSKKEQKVFLFATCFMAEGISTLQAMPKLTTKRYKVINANVLKLPDTWLLAMNGPSKEKFDEKATKAEAEIEKHINDIDKEIKSIHFANPLLMCFLGIIYFFFYYFGRHFLGLSFVLNEKCNGCGFCYKNCPSGVIKWKNNKPEWGLNCSQCFRCINLCPQNAIEISGVLLVMSFALLFVSDIPYSLLPADLTSKLEVFNTPFRVILFGLVYFGLFTAVKKLSQIPALSNIFGGWHITKNRKRYKL